LVHTKTELILNTPKGQVDQKVIKEIFSQFDKDKNGTLDDKELPDLVVELLHCFAKTHGQTQIAAISGYDLGVEGKNLEDFKELNKHSKIAIAKRISELLREIMGNNITVEKFSDFDWPQLFDEIQKYVIINDEKIKKEVEIEKEKKQKKEKKNLLEFGI